MAHMKWRGIDLMGVSRSGLMTVRSAQELAATLLKKDIALISYTIQQPLRFFSPISMQDKIDFFKQLSLLITSGIFLDQALLLVMHHCKKKHFKAIIQDILIDVEHGVSLSNALKNYPMVFDSLTIAMIETGQESGRLVEALKHLYSYQETLIYFKKKLRSIVLMPCITFLFFIAIALVIFTVIIPSFGSMITSSGQALSKNTYYMLVISDFIRSSLFLVSIIVGLGIVGGMRYCLYTYPYMRAMVEAFVLKIPGFGAVLASCSFAFFFQSLAILTETGVHIVTALSISHRAVKNQVLYNKIETLVKAVQEGHSLSISAQQSLLFSDHILALLHVGQESSCLPFIFNQIAQLYQEKINKFLTTMATLMQPLLMIILGLLITALVMAVYIPLFNVSSAIL